MDDFYIEQVVKKKDSPLAGVVKAVWGALTFSLFAGGLLSGAALLLIIGLVVGMGGYYFVLPLLSVEYEYLYLTKELSVDKILNKEKRKKCGNWSLTNMEIMAREGSDELKGYEKRECTTYNFTSGKPSDSRYVIILNDQRLTRIIFDPNEAMLKGIRDQFPRQVKL